MVGLLPIGPSLGAATTVLILGTNGVAASAAAGALLTATAAAGALCFASWALVDRLWVRAVPVPARGPSRLRPPSATASAGLAQAAGRLDCIPRRTRACCTALMEVWQALAIRLSCALGTALHLEIDPGARFGLAAASAEASSSPTSAASPARSRRQARQ